MLPICTDWESACWAITKSWLDVHMDLELAHSQPCRMEQLKSYGDYIEVSLGQMSSTSQRSVGPESWPLQVLNQQPQDISSLLQKLHSGSKEKALNFKHITSSTTFSIEDQRFLLWTLTLLIGEYA